MTKVWNQAAMRHAAYKAEHPRKMHAPVNGGEDAKLELRRPEPVPRPNGGHVEQPAWRGQGVDTIASTLFRELAECFPVVPVTVPGCLCDECRKLRISLLAFEKSNQKPCGCYVLSYQAMMEHGLDLKDARAELLAGSWMELTASPALITRCTECLFQYRNGWQLGKPALESDAPKRFIKSGAHPSGCQCWECL